MQGNGSREVAGQQLRELPDRISVVEEATAGLAALPAAAAAELAEGLGLLQEAITALRAALGLEPGAGAG